MSEKTHIGIKTTIFLAILFLFTLSFSQIGLTANVYASNDNPNSNKPTATPTTTQSGNTVTWSGNGTNNGLCSSFENDPDLNPGAGQQGWLFILTSPTGSSWELTTTFNPSTQTPGNPISGTQQGNGSIHFIVYSTAGALLESASATNGSDNSTLTVSHCELGANVTPTETTTNTPTPTDTTTPTPTTDPCADGQCITPTETTSPTPTDTPRVTPTPTNGPTSTPGPTATPTPGSSTSSSSTPTPTVAQKSTGEVLGISTLANTGSFNDSFANLAFVAGAVLFVLALKRYGRDQS